MKKQTANQKICKNCRYFSQHYAKYGLKYHTICCGHCINRSNTKMRLYDNCELWENNDIINEEQKKSLQEVLGTMAERLNEIAMILSGDEGMKQKEAHKKIPLCGGVPCGSKAGWSCTT